MIVLYKSNTGFTQKYAEWIAEELNCSAISIKDINVNELQNYETIIFGGGLHAGKINGLKPIKNDIFKMKDKNIIIFVTGATPKEAIKIEEIENANFSLEEKESLHLFYFHSGMNYEKMGISSKGMMSIFKSMLKIKKDKSPEEQGMYDTITKSNDHSKKEYINPLIECVKTII
ncbi:flavodoxin domain-containing protein [Tissierella sp. MB52-C2]|uniref:flavodoxin domain-containing protein n=1 Tax=Tissierella sp. MB52-C2 TaxID=3070999 RepID=UPI00280A76B3|nr:flavodoxin domain-containing protein [Tissierella sp. MB52-C2]WMM26993.1 flavodoxin domain-containing protein [Tissierella sp. MB52-C2]